MLDEEREPPLLDLLTCRVDQPGGHVLQHHRLQGEAAGTLPPLDERASAQAIHGFQHLYVRKRGHQAHRWAYIRYEEALVRFGIPFLQGYVSQRVVPAEGPRLEEERSNPDMKTTSMPGFNALSPQVSAFLAIRDAVGRPGQIGARGSGLLDSLHTNVERAGGMVHPS